MEINNKVKVNLRHDVMFGKITDMDESNYYINIDEDIYKFPKNSRKLEKLNEVEFLLEKNGREYEFYPDEMGGIYIVEGLKYDVEITPVDDGFELNTIHKERLERLEQDLTVPEGEQFKSATANHAVRKTLKGVEGYLEKYKI